MRQIIIILINASSLSRRQRPLPAVHDAGQGYGGGRRALQVKRDTELNTSLA